MLNVVLNCLFYLFIFSCAALLHPPCPRSKTRYRPTVSIRPGARFCLVEVKTHVFCPFKLSCDSSPDRSLKFVLVSLWFKAKTQPDVSPGESPPSVPDLHLKSAPVTEICLWRLQPDGFVNGFRLNAGGAVGLQKSQTRMCCGGEHWWKRFRENTLLNCFQSHFEALELWFSCSTNIFTFIS